jgi:hypothetical protein
MQGGPVLRLQPAEGTPPRLQFQPSFGREETFSDVLWRARAQTAPAGAMSARLRRRPAVLAPEPEPEPEPEPALAGVERSDARIGVPAGSAVACIEQLLRAAPRGVAEPQPWASDAKLVSRGELTSSGGGPAFEPLHATVRLLQHHGAPPEMSARGAGGEGASVAGQSSDSAAPATASDRPEARASGAVGPPIGASGSVQVGSAIPRSSSAATLDRVLARARVRQMSSGGSRPGSGRSSKGSSSSSRFQTRQHAANALEMSMFVASRHTAASNTASARLDDLLYPERKAVVDAADES